MEFTRLSILALICLALVGSDASQSGEDYWQSVWPNTPLPKILSDLLMPYSEIPIKANEEKQYWTIFFEHDLYPGKQMSLGVHKHSDFHHQDFQPKANQPFGASGWDDDTHGKETKAHQPFGASGWDDDTHAKETKAGHPFGVAVWYNDTHEKETKAHQPFGASGWDDDTHGKETKAHQPFGASGWDDDTHGKETKARQPFEIRLRETHKKESQPFGVHLRKESIDDFCVKPSAIGEEKYCALSLKSMVDFAISKLGTNIRVISSSFAQDRDQYVVDEVKKIGNKAVMCHRLNFEKVVFYCHQVNATTAYMVPLVASDGIKAEVLAICHHDTRGMNPDVLYDVLKVKPGTVPVCHFVGNKAVAWVPNRDASNESSDHPCVMI